MPRETWMVLRLYSRIEAQYGPKGRSTSVGAIANRLPLSLQVKM
jgi:hypothetical protein